MFPCDVGVHVAAASSRRYNSTEPHLNQGDPKAWRIAQAAGLPHSPPDERTNEYSSLNPSTDVHEPAVPVVGNGGLLTQRHAGLKKQLVTAPS